MKKLVVVVMFIGLILFLWQCTEKGPLDLESLVSALKLPAANPGLDHSQYSSGGSFLAGYQNGNIRSDRVTLNWLQSNDSDFLCYKIFRTNNLRATILEKSTVSFVDSNLAQNYHYDYKIVTMLKSGMFKADTIRIKTPMFQAPSNLNYQILSTTRVKLFWQNNAESANNFYIERKLHSEPTSAYQQIGTASDTFYVDNGVTNLMQYNYRIRAYNNYEETYNSNYLYVYVNYILTTPSLSTVNQMAGMRSVQVVWTENSNAEDGFLIYRRELGQNRELVGLALTNATNYFDNDTTNSLTIGSTYYYSVRALNRTNTDTTSYSNEIGLTIVQPSTISGLPYYEDFEDALGTEWTLLSSTIYGRIERVSGTPPAYSGLYQLLMDVNTDGYYNYNYVFLNIDLSGLTSFDNCALRFYYQTYGEEFDTGVDAVFVSGNGTNFTLAYELNTSNGYWTYVDINLRNFYSSAPYSSSYTILWQQYDNYAYPTDGIGIDDIEIVNY